MVWGDAYTKFLVECGLTQSVVDRRLYFKKGPGGRLARTTTAS